MGAQLHPGMPLGDPVTHGRHPTGELRHRPGRGHRPLDRAWERFVRLVSREHVVVGRHNRDVGLDVAAQVVLGARFAGREPMGDVRAAQVRQDGRRRAARPIRSRYLRRVSALRTRIRSVTSRTTGCNTGVVNRYLPGPPRYRAGTAVVTPADPFTAAHEVNSRLATQLPATAPAKPRYATTKRLRVEVEGCAPSLPELGGGPTRTESKSCCWV